VEIRYLNKDVENLCNNQRLLQRRQGIEIVKAMARRLTDLEAVEVLADMIQLPGKFEEFTGDRAEQFTLRLDRQFRIIFEVGNDPVPRKLDGGIDLTKVTTVIIVEAVSSHYE